MGPLRAAVLLGEPFWDNKRDFPLMFCGEVPAVLLEFWLADAGSQVICETELYAHLLVRWQCRHEMESEVRIFS